MGADTAMALDETIKQLLKELGDAINESISSSEDVNDRIQRIKDEGYNLYVVLDATIGLDRQDGSEENEGGTSGEDPGQALMRTQSDVTFRININDLAFLRSVGIDPTRKVRSVKRIEERSGNNEDGQSSS